ncbi:MAG TPA: hypothetical protein VK471_08230 [Solirubrobacterales bacterium]|nr:hypothetical protein [Solirubrobacterales bacterium]
MPGTTIKINREQRIGLYEVVRNHIGSVGGLWDALERSKDFATAERLGLEFREDFDLLDDIGWGDSDDRAEFELKMPSHDLMEVLQRLRGEAGQVLADPEESIDDAETALNFRRGYETCEEVLAALDPRAGERA